MVASLRVRSVLNDMAASEIGRAFLDEPGLDSAVILRDHGLHAHRERLRAGEGGDD
ncbi:MAG TPA: hypothetical protein GXZ30_04615 [Propionibacterium sp.]|jgi:hypothetical protein|nr:hypothetical protein [Propionibacterium sp.]